MKTCLPRFLFVIFQLIQIIVWKIFCTVHNSNYHQNTYQLHNHFSSTVSLKNLPANEISVCSFNFYILRRNYTNHLSTYIVANFETWYDLYRDREIVNEILVDFFGVLNLPKYKDNFFDIFVKAFIISGVSQILRLKKYWFDGILRRLDFIHKFYFTEKPLRKVKTKLHKTFKRKAFFQRLRENWVWSSLEAVSD